VQIETSNDQNLQYHDHSCNDNGQIIRTEENVQQPTNNETTTVNGNNKNLTSRENIQKVSGLKCL